MDIHCYIVLPPGLPPKKRKEKTTRQKLKEIKCVWYKKMIPHAGFLEELSLCNTPQPVNIDLKSFPKQNSIQTFSLNA